MSDDQDRPRSEADAELEREIRKGRKFTVADAYLFVMLRWAKHFGLPLSPRMLAYFERIAVFEQSTAGALGVVNKRIIHPLADFVGQSRNVLRENARVIEVGEVSVGLAARSAVVAADAATA